VFTIVQSTEEKKTKTEALTTTVMRVNPAYEAWLRIAVACTVLLPRNGPFSKILQR
jgi:hypothetical protein